MPILPTLAPERFIPALVTFQHLMSTLNTAVATTNPRGWLSSAPFDLVFIVGVALLSLTAGAVIVARPDWFYFLLFLDLWLLGYPHVVATFSRLSFDMKSFKEHRFLVLVLPWIVLGAAFAVGRLLGFWALATTYLYWQWFHYTRQSYGILRILSRRVNGEAAAQDIRLSKWALYLLPLWGILHRSYQKQPRFLDLEIRYLPTPRLLLACVAALALATLVVWIGRSIYAWRRGRLPVALTIYMLSHFAVFLVGYLVIDDITQGWLMVNIWHNAQYLLIVWMYNRNRFKGGIEREHWLLSALSQNRPANTIAYFISMLFFATVLYGSIALALKTSFFAALPLTSIVVYQTINFHHYIVDSLIWKVRKPEIRHTLGLAT